MTTVCSGFHPAGYTQYGKRFIDTFAAHWPQDVDLLAYTEEPVPMPRGECRSLWDCPGALAFEERHGGDPRRCGLRPIPGWRPKDRKAGYAWRFDVLRWYKQCVIPAHAALGLPDGEILAWLDADVVTFAPVPPKLIEEMMIGVDLAYLGRNAYHSEIGFWAVRLNPITRSFIDDLAMLWASDGILSLAEHHSAFAFDYCRKTAQLRGLRARNLTERAGAGHVWFSMPLGTYADHLKGSTRKALGYSPENPIHWWEGADANPSTALTVQVQCAGTSLACGC